MRACPGYEYRDASREVLVREKISKARTFAYGRGDVDAGKGPMTKREAFKATLLRELAKILLKASKKRSHDSYWTKERARATTFRLAGPQNTVDNSHVQKA